MRAVLAGAGLVAQFWLPALHAQGVEVVGVIEPEPDRHPELPRVTGFEDADLAIVLTPPALHDTTIASALDAGCHVLCEKPLSLTLAGARASVARAARAGRTLAVMQNRRYQPGLIALREADIGALVLLAADLFLARPFAGTYVHSHPLLHELAVHAFDAARFVAGADAVAVTCAELDPPNSPFAGPAVAVATFELANGALFSYRGSWVAPGHETSYDGTWRASGSTGTALWDGAAEDTGHAACLRDLLDAIRSGRPAPTDGADNLHTLAMVIAAERSARERRRVPLDEL
jgi:predicted dehydrogenase